MQWDLGNVGQCFVQGSAGRWAVAAADEAFILSNGNLGNLTGVATAHLCMAGEGGAGWIRQFSSSSKKYNELPCALVADASHSLKESLKRVVLGPLVTGVL